jgi:PPM family protein phosphatase
VKPNERAHLYVAANTHPGMKGKNNEDRFAISAHWFGSHKEIPSVLAVVCDGIGGHRAGEVAAEIAVETISKVVAKSDGSQPLATLKEAIQKASAAVQSQSEANPERRGMGATCVCAWVINDCLYTASVGDSRLYLIRENQIQQLTTDHTWVQEAIEFGALTPEQARGHPNAHVIRRYLGSKAPAEPDFRLRLRPEESDEQAESNQGMRIQKGDVLLLCSDGLTDLVDQEEIKAQIQSQDREAALQSLISLANERGGHDNITAVILETPPTFAPIAPPVARPRQEASPARRLALPCAISAGLIAFVSLAAVGVFWIFDGWPLINRTPTAPVSPTILPGLQATQIDASPSSTAVSITPPSIQAQATSTLTATPSGSGGSPQDATYTPWPTNTPRPTSTPPPTETFTPTATEPAAAQDLPSGAFKALSEP